MCIRDRVRITEGPESLQAEISGDDLGILIGRRGQTIDALEYLAGIAVFSGGHPRKHVELDAEGYKERRRKQIERVAMRKACLLYTSPSPRDRTRSRMPSSACTHKNRTHSHHSV